MARRIVKHVNEFSVETITALGERKAEARQRQKIEIIVIFILQEITKNARRKLESHVDSAVSCESQTCSENTIFKTSKVSPQDRQCDEHRREAIPREDKIHKKMHEQKVEAHGSQRCSIEESG